MINREVIYERTVTGSYMKIPVGINAGLDERLMLQRKLQGTLPVEKTYMDGGGQYWYNISGKQSLDTYCRVKEVGIEFVEKLAVSICSELDILEWNLVQASCLMLDPELIFITNANREFIFTLYPGNTTQIEIQFQQLMEYLLTKINHRDETAVRAAYGIYELTLEEGYSIMDIRETIMKAKQRQIAQEADRTYYAAEKEVSAVRGRTRDSRAEDVQRKTKKDHSDGKREAKQKKRRKSETAGNRERSKGESGGQKERVWKRLTEFIKRQLGYETASRKENESLVFPDEEIYVPSEEIHPTVYLGGSSCALQGILLYQGSEQMQDICLEGTAVRIGFGREADVRIAHDAVSQMHARIDREGDAYYIEDLNSTNGTYVNGELLAYKERRQLKANDTVRFANLQYRFC